ncbi:MAG: hypothetical protein J4469_03100 [Candidatus Aenigmarchaeota archaeon]|nr:hypothetical protein [Candidatus Aenigmarchaeota archaeon]
MFFKKKERDDIREIKQAMVEPPETDHEELPSFIEEHKEAPLFVKVEKYRDIITTLSEMKGFVGSIKQLYGVIHEAETVRSDALKILRNSVARLEKNIYEMDSELLRPRGFMVEAKETETEMSHIGDSLGDLQRQIAMLKKEMQELS